MCAKLWTNAHKTFIRHFNVRRSISHWFILISILKAIPHTVETNYGTVYGDQCDQWSVIISKNERLEWFYCRFHSLRCLYNGDLFICSKCSLDDRRTTTVSTTATTKVLERIFVGLWKYFRRTSFDCTANYFIHVISIWRFVFLITSLSVFLSFFLSIRVQCSIFRRKISF